MQPDEVALSEVHLTKGQRKFVGQNKQGYTVCRSEFKFKVLNEFKESYTDEDGDLVVTREKDIILMEAVINIEHSLETQIKDVGLQVWSGCMLLCDYILSHQENFKGKVILELGCGIGLASILLSGLAQHVYATDIGEDILKNSYNNVQRNNNFPEEFGRCCKAESVISVRELNWIEETVKNDGQFGWTEEDEHMLSLTEVIVAADDGQFGWTEEDEHMLSLTEVIVAADVVYNNDLTDGLFFWLHKLFRSSLKYAYISVEKRLNFTLDDMEATCPAYKYFIQCLEKLKKSTPDGHLVTVEQINTEFPQAFYPFERSKYLELWKITLMPV